MTDMFAQATALRVVSVFEPGNETGWQTPKVLYDPSVHDAEGNVRAPTLDRYQFWIDHGTVGTNTLRFWGTGGSVANKTWSLAQYLVPKESTVYADGQAHDTTNVIFKMIPDNRACNHVGISMTPWSASNCKGMEYESLQNGTHDITDMQYIKGALVFAHDAALHGIPDWFRLSHGIVARPWGRRTDPWAGRFNIAYSWELVQAIRRDPRIWAFWGLPH